jgi:hypothetical protein
MRNILSNRSLFGLVSVMFLTFTAVAQALPGTSESEVAKEFKRLKTLQAALEKIPMEKMETEPHKSFLKKNEKEITYSEPAGQWYVRSELFWNLRDRTRDLPVADEIAWTAAQNPIPGECEGYINCYLYLETITNGRYLLHHPKGKHSKQAITEIVERLEMLAADDSQYDGPTEASDRAELKKMLAELNTQLSATDHTEKAKAIALITKLETKYK